MQRPSAPSGSSLLQRRVRATQGLPRRTDDAQAQDGFVASGRLLLMMLSAPVEQRVELRIDCCPVCNRWLAGRWTRSDDQMGLPAHLHRYLIQVSCETCGFEALSQHAATRWS